MNLIDRAEGQSCAVAVTGDKATIAATRHRNIAGSIVFPLRLLKRDVSLSPIAADHL